MTNMHPQVSPYGTWESPLTARILAEQNTSIKAVRVNENTGKMYYLQGDHNNRFTIVEWADRQSRSVLPDEYSVGSTVNGYGGGAFAIERRGNLIFSDAESQDVCLLAPDTRRVERILPSCGNSYADFDPHPRLSQYILAVKEQPLTNGVPSTMLVVIDIDSKTERVVRNGSDFYTHPRFSPDGSQICWVQWSFPDMPWAAAVLCRAGWLNVTLADVMIFRDHRGVSQPRWGPDGSLFFASGNSGVPQLHRILPGEGSPNWIHLAGLEEVDFADAEFWLGSSTFVALTADKLIATYAHKGISTIILVNLSDYSYVNLQLGLIDISYDAMRRVSRSSFAILGSTATQPYALYHVSLDPDGGYTVLCVSSVELRQLPIAFLSTPEPISFQRTFSSTGPGISYGFYMAPTNPKYRPPPSTLPPCIIFCHGGPTKHARPSVNIELQFLTSRGYAVVILNYTGSTSYGREHRDRLNGRWGVEDVNDAASCRAFLVGQRTIDGKRVGIMGGSAGGYLTLQALCTYPKLWAGGISFCGISDLERFAQTTHKFEKCYDDLLVFGGTRRRAAPLCQDRSMVRQQTERFSGPTEYSMFLSRSPIHGAKNLNSPLLLLQGAEDKVVVPAQATYFFEAVPCEKRHLVHTVVFAGEGHGFHLASSIQKSLELQEWWWRMCLTVDMGEHDDT